MALLGIATRTPIAEARASLLVAIEYRFHLGEKLFSHFGIEERRYWLDHLDESGFLPRVALTLKNAAIARWNQIKT
jgi:hypothetical protein